MKKQFTEQCVDLVLDRVAPVKVVAKEFKAILEEKISKTDLDDHFHKFTFTLNYPGHHPSSVSDIRTLDGAMHVGTNYLLEIQEKLQDRMVIDKNYDITLNHEYNLDNYKGVITFNFKQ